MSSFVKTREARGQNTKAPMPVRILAGVVAIPIIASGVAAAVVEFPLGLVWGAMLVALGAAAALLAIRGRAPFWLETE